MANRGIGVVQQSMVCLDDITIFLRGGEGIAQMLSLLREQDCRTAAE
jgi:hypothetical protein